MLRELVWGWCSLGRGYAGQSQEESAYRPRGAFGLVASIDQPKRYAKTVRVSSLSSEERLFLTNCQRSATSLDILASVPDKQI